MDYKDCHNRGYTMKYKLFNAIQKLQDQALVLGDLKTAIKLNWLKYSVDSMDIDTLCETMMKITIKGV